MSLESGQHQKTGQPELPCGSRGETSRTRRSDEPRAAAHEDERSGNDDDDLMALVVASKNVEAALRRVMSNKGSAGVDGMTVDSLPRYLDGNWSGIREALLADRYQPEPVRRYAIPKKDGGVRELGIPTVVDRLIQQCILQVLQPRFDPTFSPHSHGFRPGRSAHDAIRAAQHFLQEGRRWVVDVDLEAFFDRVNHDVLMSRLAKRIADRRLLGLIRRYLTAGMMAEGIVVRRERGTPQGGPLSPLLANVLLDEVDKELESRGHAFARYADDCNVYVRSRRAGERVMRMLRRIFERLHLRINEAKSAVATPWRRAFLGYSFRVAKDRSIKTRLAKKSLEALKDRVRESTKRSGGRSLASVIAELRRYLIGWKNYFRLVETPTELVLTDAWIRRRLRALQLFHWRHGPTIYRELRRRGVRDEAARKVASTRGRWWMGALLAGTVIPNSLFDKLGLPRLAA